MAFSQLQVSPVVQVSRSNTPHVENSIAINPTNYKNVLVSAAGSVANQIVQVPNFNSTDHGITWIGSDNTPGYETPSDGNSVAFFDYYGNAFLGFLGKPGSSPPYIMKSTDGGTTWGSAIQTKSDTYYIYDKPHAQADISGVHPSNVYVAYSYNQPIGSGLLNIEMAISTDDGQSFGSHQSLEVTSYPNYVNGPNISIGPNGEVYVFWYMNENTMRFSKSTNGGQSFSGAQSIFPFDGIESAASPGSGLNVPLACLNKTYAHSFPSSGVDRSNGQYRGNLYVIYSALDNPLVNGGIPRVYLQMSTNSGSSWLSSPIQVSDPAATEPQWLPSLAVDPVSGYLFVSYFSMLASNYTTVRYMAVSTNAGATWSRVQVSNQTFVPTDLGTNYQPGYMGDYYETAAYGAEGYACWSDNHTGTFETYISKVGAPITVIGDQFLQDGVTRVGNLKQWSGTSFGSPLGSHYSFPLIGGALEVLLGDQAVYSGQKYYQWKAGNKPISDLTNFHVFDEILSTNLSSNFLSTNNATVQAQLLDGGNPGGSVSFEDPWLINYSDPNYGYNKRNLGISAPLNSVGYAQNNIGLASPDSGVFLNQSGPLNNWPPPYYSVSAPATQTIGSFTGYFLNWSANNSSASFQSAISYQTPVVFNTAGAVVSANYKAHLGTGRPDLGDAKNQRRFITNGNVYVTVYESFGNVWITSSFDGGTTWMQEEQLNVNPGQGKNPTISNLWSYNGNYYGIISWIEINTSGIPEMHLQTFTIPLGAPYTHPVNYGWSYLAGGNRTSDNHRTILQMGDNSTPTNNARPVLQINDAGGGTAYIMYAKETNGSGISWSWFDINESQNKDLSSATFNPTGSNIISTNTSDNCPVLTWYPSTYGYPARTDLYYLGAGYAGYTLRVVRYSIDNGTTQVLPNGYQETTYASLQGVVNPLFATIGLVADGVASGGRVTVYYTKPTYSTSAPAVSTIYLNLMQPTLQAENVSSFGNPVADVSMKSTSSSTWYLASNGSQTLTSVGNNIGGVFSRLLAPSGDKTVMLIRNNVTPAQIQKSSSGGQALNKSSDIQTNTRCVFMKGTAATQQLVGILDFSGADVTVLDTIQTGNQVSVRIGNPTSFIVKQYDSLRVTAGVELKRNGKAVQTYSPSSWNNVSAQNIAGIQSGDILQFSLGVPKDTLWWYKEVSIGLELFKQNKTSSGDALIPIVKSIGVYPNPFNPTTTFRVSLPEAGRARLTVFNMLGQKVAMVLDSYLEAGYTNIRFDGSNLASGVYFYRLEMDNYVQSGKMLLMK